MSLHDQIQSLVAKLALDLEGLVRSAAVSAVESALGGAPAVPAARASGAAPARKSGPGPGVTGPTASKPRKGKRARRTAEQVQATADKIYAFVRANPNTNIDALRRALSITRTEWIVSLRLLMDAKRLQSKGQKRATTYTAR